jgi:hypothetical protein
MVFQVTTFWDGILFNSKHPPCSHILHTCPPSYSLQRHLIYAR